MPTGLNRHLCDALEVLDIEKFDTVKSFVEEVTPQAMRGFSRLWIRAEGEQLGAEVHMARKKVKAPPFCGNRGVVIKTWARGGDVAASKRAREVCDRMRVTVKRGSMPWTRGLKRTELSSPSGVREELALLDRRRSLVTMMLVTILASMPYYMFVLASLLGVLNTKQLDDKLIYLLGAQTLILILGVLLARIVMPPIELAEITPGRRMLRLVGRSGLVTVLTGLLLAFLKTKAGFSG